MRKAILIGNGFTSQLINDYTDQCMKEKLLQFFKVEYSIINELFDCFRISNFSSKDIYSYGGGLYPSKNFYPNIGLFPRPDKILYNEEIKDHVIKALESCRFQDSKEIYENYLISYGLIFEVIKKEINSIENLIKVISMFKEIGKIDKIKESEIKKIANSIYYNNGNYGLNDTCLKNNKKIKEFFSHFDFVYTTNYDLILDDICKNQDKVFHLHGGFNFEHRNLKVTKRLTDKEAYIVWGINGDEKYRELSPGCDFGNFRYDAVRFDNSLIADYFSSLENNEYHEIHIFGFSGENDQHINKRIVNNIFCKKIFFYCNPNSINDRDYHGKIKELYYDAKTEIILEPWTKIWECIM